MFNKEDYPDLLVGLESPDDAAVWKIDDERALVMTTDFFTPVVDDPFEYGSIAAANSLSDIYAMGAKPFLALNIAAFPPDLPPEFTSEIIRGGAEKVREAGAVLGGGHTIQDKEPKYGLVALGFVHPGALLIKSGVEPGDKLVLTKPLGFGAITTALKQGKASTEDAALVTQWMSKLNDKAAQIAVALKLRAATDITGFSLIGHCYEMAHASGLGIKIIYEQIPILEPAREYARAWTFPGGAFDNKLYFSQYTRVAPHIDEASEMLLFDPQTSGGLLLAVPPQKIPDLQKHAGLLDQSIWIIGEAVEGDKIEVI